MTNFLRRWAETPQQRKWRLAWEAKRVSQGAKPGKEERRRVRQLLTSVMLGEGDPFEVVRSLGEGADDRTVKPLLEIAFGGSKYPSRWGTSGGHREQLKRAALEALSRLGDKRAIPPLLDQLRIGVRLDSDRAEFLKCLLSLAQDDVELLLHFLSLEYYPPHPALYATLWQSGDPRAVTTLRMAVEGGRHFEELARTLVETRALELFPAIVSRTVSDARRRQNSRGLKQVIEPLLDVDASQVSSEDLEWLSSVRDVVEMPEHRDEDLERKVIFPPRDPVRYWELQRQGFSFIEPEVVEDLSPIRLASQSELTRRGISVNS